MTYKPCESKYKERNSMNKSNYDRMFMEPTKENGGLREDGNPNAYFGTTYCGGCGAVMLDTGVCPNPDCPIQL